MNNLKRLKKLILANKETRRLYRMMQFLAIFMVISCTIIVVIAKWIEHDQNQKREELFGSWDEVFLDVPTEDLNYFKQNAFLEQISIQSIQEKVFLEGDKRVVIGSCDDNFLEMGNIELLEGRMPEKENEVAVEEEYLEILGVTGIGDVVSRNSEVKSLRGYQIKGIIKSYTKKWKIINNRVDFVNCFIYSSKIENTNITNIYVEYSPWSKNDQEINWINYYTNIQLFRINGKAFYKYTLIFFLFEIFLLFILYGEIYGKRQNNIHIRKNRIIYYIFLTLISLLIFLSVNHLLRKIYNHQIISIIELIGNILNNGTSYTLEDVQSLNTLYWITKYNETYQISYLLEFPLIEILDIITHLMQIMFLKFLLVIIIYNKKSSDFNSKNTIFALMEYFYVKRKIKVSMRIENLWILFVFCSLIFLDLLIVPLCINYPTYKDKVDTFFVYLVAIIIILIVSNIEIKLLLKKQRKGKII